MIYRPLSATTPVTGILILALSLPLAAQKQAPAQRGGPPRAETPQLIVGVLESSDRRIGIAAADAIRKRMQSEHNASDIYLTPRPTIDETLSSPAIRQTPRSVRAIYSCSPSSCAVITRSLEPSSRRRAACGRRFASLRSAAQS